MKRILSLILVLTTLISTFALTASAASTPEEAMGEINIYNGDYPMKYLAVNGQVKSQFYTYFLDETGKEIPAYCVNPTLDGVTQKVGAGESIRYLITQRASDPKVVGLIANMYPHRSVAELGLENEYQAFYVGKIALWCYLIPSWDISAVTVNPTLTGLEMTRAEKMLAAVKDIYNRGMAWTSVPTEQLSAVPDMSAAYLVTINGAQYYQQVFTVSSETAVDGGVHVEFQNPDDVPDGARIVGVDNLDISTIAMEDSDGTYTGKFKVLYPVEAVADKSGSVQFSLSANVAKYVIFYAVCQETGKYGELQNYLCDTDPVTTLTRTGISNYTSDQTTITPVEPDEPDEPAEPTPPAPGELRIVKFETGTETPLAGASFEVKGPGGDVIGEYTTDESGTITIPVTEEGSYVVTETDPPKYHLLDKEPTKTVTVHSGETAVLTYHNQPYGDLRIEKIDGATGGSLEGARVQIKHIESGAIYTGETTTGGSCTFAKLLPGAYEIRELSAPKGWQLDPQTYTTTVVAGECVTYTLKNAAKPGLRIVKYDSQTHEILPKVTFEIFKDTVSLGRYETDQLGQILLTDLEPGTYKVVEVDTGDVSHIIAPPQEIELTLDGGIMTLYFFNDTKPGMWLVKVDSADPSKVIPNAVFEIKSVDGRYGPEEFTTGADGTIDLSDLEPGGYVVTEKSCPGYIIDDAQRIIHLEPNEDARFVFTNSVLPSLRLVKLSADGSPLEGVTFRLARIADGSRYLDRTTDANGEIDISGLEPGVYSVKETATRNDHIIDPKEYHVELFAGKTSTIVLENDKRPNLTIYKRDADTGEPISDTIFSVKAADGHSVQEVKTGPDGSATVENLLPGVYEIVEKSVPSPYLLDAPSQLVTLYPNRDRDVYFENHKAPTIEIIKVDSITGNPLPNVRFQVWYASNSTETGEYNDLGVFTTDEDGRIDLDGPTNGLRDGWFRVQELAPPKGYSIKDSDTQEAFIQAGKGHTFRFENVPLSAIVVWKYDEVTGAAVEGCIFQIRYLGGTSGTGGTVIGTYRTSANGSFTVTGLQAGTYVIEEIASDADHVITSAPQTVYISGEDQDVVQVYFGNAPKGSLLIKKIDAVTHAPLSDVEFFITASDGTVVGNANGKYVTDSEGSILIDGLTPDTTLVVKETRARDGYLLDDTPQTVKIKAGETVTLEFRNQPQGNLIVEKRDSVTGKPLEGVEFEFKYADGSYVDNGNLSSLGKYYTDKNGQIIIPGITGTVVVTEVQSIPGYTIHEETRSQTVQVNPNDTQKLIFYNDPIGGVEIIKVNENDKAERIPGVTFEIRRLDDGLVDTVTTGEDGRVFVTLEDDAYYALEIDCPKEYKLDSTPHYFEVKDGHAPTLTITNRAFSGVLIHKIDSMTGEGIYGVTFLLYDSKMNPIDQITTDQNGYAYLDSLDYSGKLYLRELEADGYIVDSQLKTVYVKPGETTEIEWKNTPITGQIQVYKYAAESSSVNGLPAGTLLEGAVFEIYDKAGNVVDTIVSDSRGLAVSKQLPLGRYTIRETKAPNNYCLSAKELTAYLEYEGQILRFEVTNEPLNANVSITKRGYSEVMPGQQIRYDFSDIGNNSNVSLESFYWRDTLPAQSVQLSKIVTGTYNAPGNYKVVYKTNLSGDYRTLADSLSTAKNYVLDASPAALGLASNEYVTEFMFVFGTVPANFRQVEAPQVICTVYSWLTGGSQFNNVADVGGIYKGQWLQAASRWVTVVYKPTQPQPTLPKTGY